MNNGKILYFSYKDIKGNLEEIPDGWDQFDLNEKKYQVKSDYDEIKYTTELNKENLTEEEKIKAEKIMRVKLFFSLKYL